jgi:hypothetical protein
VILLIARFTPDESAPRELDYSDRVEPRQTSVRHPSSFFG